MSGRFDALGLPLPVRRAEGVSQLAVVLVQGLEGELEALAQRLGDGPAQLLRQVVQAFEGEIGRYGASP